MSLAKSRTAQPLPLPPDADIGALLRHWRTARRLSQLELALDADVSSRHLSYVETGRSRPSREMLLRLADALEVPLRERNALLVAAGFAPRYYETGLAAPEMARMRGAIELILRHQQPFPAFVLDRYWNILMTNDAAPRCTRFLLGAEPTEGNMLRLCLHPNGLRRMMPNWEETAGDLIRHLHHQIATSPADERAKDLLAEVLAYPGVPAQWRTRDVATSPTPLLTTVFRKGDVELRFFSTITTFGTPHDVTLEELRIECSFPADESTATMCRNLFSA
ncbi:MAG TPA: helix-turn-helix transcriptional regulator [Gemmatimonadaceae bacterium]|nr:helix-turn-helix transcriptional regulator [Gemmatimonadaceae bacterium]